jgi:hypothetical protein
MIYIYILYTCTFLNSKKLTSSGPAQDVGIKDTLGGLLLAGTDLANQLAKKAWGNGNLMIFPGVSICPFWIFGWVTPSAILKTHRAFWVQ